MASTAERPRPLDGSPEGREAYLAYARAFSAADFETFSAYYTDDVVCELGGRLLEGRAGIVDFYRPMFERVREHLTIHMLVADQGGIAVDATSTFTAIKEASDFAPMPLKLGETRKVSVFVLYTLREGKISRIRVARFGNV